MTLIFPWPPQALRPNARVHWSKKAMAARSYRHTGFILTKAAKLIMPEGKLRLVIEFAPPTRRHYDADNLLASCKALFDGIADAIGRNDRDFTYQFSKSHEPIKGGEVRVRIEAYQDVVT